MRGWRQKSTEADRERERRCPFKLKWGHRSAYRGKLMTTLETWTQTQFLSSALHSLLPCLSFLFSGGVCVSVYGPLSLFHHCSIMSYVQHIFLFFSTFCSANTLCIQKINHFVQVWDVTCIPTYSQSIHVVWPLVSIFKAQQWYSNTYRAKHILSEVQGLSGM